MILGAAGSIISIPCLPEMMQTIEEDREFCDKYEKKQVETVISSIFVTSQSVGEAIGPLMNSILISTFGFQTAHEIFAAYLIIWSGLYFTYSDNLGMFEKPEAP